MEDLLPVENEIRTENNTDDHLTEKDATHLLTKENFILLCCTLVLGVAADFLFYQKPFGISYPIFILAIYGVFLWNSRSLLIAKPSFGWFLTLPVLALSMTYAFFTNEVFRFFNTLAIPILIVIQTTLITRSNKYPWFIANFFVEVLYGLFCRIFIHITKPFVILSKFLQSKSFTKNHPNVAKILIGLLFAAPLLIIVIALLASADEVFGYYINNLPRLFEDLQFEDIFLQCLFISVVFLLSFSYILSFKESNTAFPKEENPVSVPSNKSWDPVIVSTILFLVNMIYVFFDIIQFAYLFEGSVPLNSSHAEYARKGFFELVIVTLINLTLLLLTLNLTRKEGKPVDVLLKCLNSLLIGCTFVMLISALYRMWMYEEAYGYTYLRVLTYAFMIFMFALLLITLYRVWKESISLLKAYLLIGLVSYLIINYVNIDAMIAHNNLARYLSSPSVQIDVKYLEDLSFESVPVLIEYVHDNKIGSDIQQVLLKKKVSLNKKRHWQSSNFSEYRAEQLLSKVFYTEKISETK